MSTLRETVGAAVDDAANATSNVRSVNPAMEPTLAGGRGVDLVSEDGETVRWVDIDTRRAFVEDESYQRLRRLEFASLGANAVTERIVAADHRLTPSRGLRFVTPAGAFAPFDPSDLRPGRTLLFIHGTFSRSEAPVGQLAAVSPEGVGRLFSAYANVLAFDYPTLSAPAIASALELHILTRRFPGPIDVVAHSQGALVARYWLEALCPERLASTRLVMVGGAGQGTSLASPANLSRAVDYLTNLCVFAKDVWGLVAGTQNVMSVMLDIVGLMTSASGTLANAAIGAGIELVPGLAGMSRVSTNATLERLQRLTGQVPLGYHAVSASFRPPAVGWAFWRAFHDLDKRAAHLATRVVFRESSDLVIETSLHSNLGTDAPLPADRVLSFRDGGGVHHTNYFQQPETASAIQRWLLAER